LLQAIWFAFGALRAQVLLRRAARHAERGKDDRRD
jgi:hypothetical protein